jgi:hypothetical protein
MTTINVTPVEILAGLGVLVILFSVWRAGARRARAAADAARAGARLMSLTGRVMCNAALIVAVQWVVITYQANRWVLLVVLALPAVFASYALTRALTVTAIDLPRQRGGRR